MEYKVVPFVATINPVSGTSAHVAEQLENMIMHYTNQGWKYIRLEGVSTFVHAETGCFGIGAKPGYNTAHQMVVFQK
jgi:hypothetical protein